MAGKSKQLKLGKAQVYLFCGTDEFMVADAAQKAAQQLCPEADQALAMEVVEADASNSDAAIEMIRRTLGGLRTMGFFGGGKVVWLKGATFFSAGFRGSEELKKEIAVLKEEIERGLGPDTVLLISMGKPDKRSVFYKACKASGEVHEFDMPERDYQAQPVAEARTLELLQAAGKTMDESVLSSFLDKTGFDTRTIHSEVEKVALYVGERERITIDDVRAVVSAGRESAAWDLADAVADRKPGRAVAMVRQLEFQGENAVGLIITLENRFRELLMIRECLDTGVLRMERYGRRQDANWKDSPRINEVFGPMDKDDPRKMHPYRLGLQAAQAAKYSAAELSEGLSLLQETHRKLVTTGLPGSLLLELLVIRLTRKRKAA